MISMIDDVRYFLHSLKKLMTPYYNIATLSPAQNPFKSISEVLRMRKTDICVDFGKRVFPEFRKILVRFRQSYGFFYKVPNTLYAQHAPSDYSNIHEEYD